MPWAIDSLWWTEAPGKLSPPGVIVVVVSVWLALAITKTLHVGHEEDDGAVFVGQLNDGRSRAMIAEYSTVAAMPWF